MAKDTGKLQRRILAWMALALLTLMPISCAVAAPAPAPAEKTSSIATRTTLPPVPTSAGQPEVVEPPTQTNPPAEAGILGRKVSPDASQRTELSHAQGEERVVRAVWEREIPKEFQGKLYELAILPETRTVVATSSDRVTTISLDERFRTSIELGKARSAILALEGRYVGILTHRLNDVAAFEVVDLAGKPLTRIEDLRHFNYRLAPKGDSFIGIDAGGQHIAPKAEKLVYRFFDASGTVKGQVESIAPQPIDSAYTPDGRAFLVNNRDGFSSLDVPTAHLRWRVAKQVKFFASANGALDIVVVSDALQRRVAEAYKNGQLLWSFTLDQDVRNVAISPNGEFIVATDAKMAHLFKPTSGRPVWSVTVPDSQLSINSVAVSDNGLVALGAQADSLNRGVALIFDASGKQIFRKDLTYALSNAWIPGVQFDSTGLLCLIKTLELLTLVAVR